MPLAMGSTLLRGAKIGSVITAELCDQAPKSMVIVYNYL